MSLFDPKSFLSQTLEGAHDTKTIPLPIGSTYGQITKIDINSGQKDGKTWYRFEATYEITDRDYLSGWKLEDGKAEKGTVRYGFPLDVNEGGGIAMGPGKNVKLGRLREATGTNQPGKTLDSMVGQITRLEIGNKPNANDPEIVYAEVTAVAPY